MLLRSNFSSFPHYFVYIFLTSGVKLHIHLLNVVVQFIVFLILSTLIYRGMDISKCFSESLGIRDNESRLYYSMYEWRANARTILCVWAGSSESDRFALLQRDVFRLMRSIYYCHGRPIMTLCVKSKNKRPLGHNAHLS